METTSGIRVEILIQDLPEEILEHIFSYISPYNDFKSGMLVCKNWHRIFQGVRAQKIQDLHNSVAKCNCRWSLLPPETGPTITGRYSHSACYHDKSMYVFGGCTSSSTTFNDLWRFDLSSRQWIRPLAMGTYPSPKACASMVAYQGSLVLFGGWSHPTPYPLHRPARYFSQLHTYVPVTNRWHQITTTTSPPATAGHSASVLGDQMVMFGGSQGHGHSCNDLWTLDFLSMSWKKQITGKPRPLSRYGQSQITIDCNHILVIGGCGGPNGQYNDIWLLTLDNDGSFYWREMLVLNPEHSAPQLWCHPACKVGDNIVVLSKPTRLRSGTVPPFEVQVRPERVWVPPTEQDEPQGDQEMELHQEQGLNHQGEGQVQHQGVGQVQHKGDGQLESHEVHVVSSNQQRFLEQGSSQVVYSNHRENTVDESSVSHSRSENRTVSQEQCYSSETHGKNKILNSNKQYNTVSEHEKHGLSGQNIGACSMDYDSSDVHLDMKDKQLMDASAHGKPDQPRDSDRHDDAGIGNRANGITVACGGVDAPGISRLRTAPDTTSPKRVREGMPSIRPNAMNNRMRQLEILKKHEERLKEHIKRAKETENKMKDAPKKAQTKKVKVINYKNCMQCHILNISNAVTEGVVTWQPVRDTIISGAPEETIFYSLVEGRGELIMFGGVQTELSGMQKGIFMSSNIVSNSLYFITP